MFESASTLFMAEPGKTAFLDNCSGIWGAYSIPITTSTNGSCGSPRSSLYNDRHPCGAKTEIDLRFEDVKPWVSSCEP